MYTFTTKNLTESLTLLVLEREEDGEGGWKDKWEKGPVVWAAIWPLLERGEKPHYRLIMRASVELPEEIRFLWPLRYGTKRLKVITTSVFIQNNCFKCMTAVEDAYA